MPDGWQPVTAAFLDGLELGIYAGFAAMVVLIFVSAVRRVVGV